MNQSKRYTLDEISIDFWYMIAHVLFKWKNIVIIAIVGAFLLGSSNLISQIYQKQSIQKDSIQYEEKLVEYEEKLEEYEDAYSRYKALFDNYNNQVDYYQIMIDSKEYYLENSVIAKINPEKVLCGTVTYTISVNPQEFVNTANLEVVDPADAIVGAYNTYVTSGMDYSKLSSELNISEGFLRETVITDYSYLANRFSITVIGDSENTIKKILDYIVLNLDENKDKIIDQGYSYSINNSQSSITEQMRPELYENIKNYYDSIISLQNSQNNAIINRDKLEEPTKPNKPTIVSVGDTGISKKSVVKYSILGCVVFGVFSALFFSVIYILSGKIHSGTEIEAAWNIPLICNYEQIRQNDVITQFLKRIFTDKTLCNIKTGDNKVLMNIKIRKPQCKNVLMIGNISSEVMDSLTTRFGENDKSHIWRGYTSVFDGADIVDDMKEEDIILLVTQKDISSYTSIINEIKDIELLGKNIDGYISI